MLQDSEELARKRMLSSSLNSGGSEGSTETKTSNDNSSALNLQPIRLGQSHATQLRNRDLLITQGTQIDCTLETKIITSQPGMTTCHLTRDIYSTSGRVVLLDRGSKVVGFTKVAYSKDKHVYLCNGYALKPLLELLSILTHPVQVLLVKQVSVAGLIDTSGSDLVAQLW